MSVIHKILVGTCVVWTFALGSVQAGPISSTLFVGLQRLSDDGALALIDMGGSEAGRLDVGDRLRGIFKIDDTNQGVQTRMFGDGTNNQLAGIFDITVATKAGVGPYGFTFLPTALATSGFGAFGAPTDTAMIFFEGGATPTFTRQTGATCTTAAQNGDCEANISSGAPFWFGGFTPASGFWAIQTTSDLIAFPTGSFQLGIHRLTGGSGPALADVLCTNPLLSPPSNISVDFCASGSLMNIAGATPYHRFINMDQTVDVIRGNSIPEPNSFALLGLGLYLAWRCLVRRGWRFAASTH